MVKNSDSINKFISSTKSSTYRNITEMDTMLLTKESYENMKEEYFSKMIEKQKLAQEIGEYLRDTKEELDSRGCGTLSSDMYRIECQLKSLEAKLKNSIICDNNIVTDGIDVGDTVTVYFADFEEYNTFKFVDYISSSSDVEEVSIDSPIGKAIYRKKINDEVSYKTETGMNVNITISDVVKNKKEDNDIVRKR